MRSVQRGISALFLVVAILTVAVVVTFGYFVFSQNLSEKIKAIDSFDSCAKHYPVMESYPQQCNTPDGKHFTRELSEEEKQRLVPPLQPSPSVSADETANWKTYTNTVMGFSLQYPEDLEIKEIEGAAVFTKKGPTQRTETEFYDGIILTFSTGDLKSKSLEDFVNLQVDQVKNNALVLAEPSKIVIGDKVGYISKINGAGVYEDIYFPMGQGGYLRITNGIADPTNQGFQDVVKKMLKTLKIL